MSQSAMHARPGLVRIGAMDVPEPPGPRLMEKASGKSGRGASGTRAVFTSPGA